MTKGGSHSRSRDVLSGYRYGRIRLSSRGSRVKSLTGARRLSVWLVEAAFWLEHLALASECIDQAAAIRPLPGTGKRRRFRRFGGPGSPEPVLTRSAPQAAVLLLLFLRRLQRVT